MAVQTVANNTQKHLIDYLGKGLPPYMSVSIHQHPAELKHHMMVDLKLAVHFKGRPAAEYTSLTMRKIAQIQEGSDISTYRDALAAIQKDYAKEIAAGVIDGRQFNRFAFEGGTVQELGRVGKPYIQTQSTPPGPNGFTKYSIAPADLPQDIQDKMLQAIMDQPPSVNDGTLAKLMQKAAAAANTPPNVIDLTFDKDDIDLADLRHAITEAQRRNMHTDMIWITPAQLNSLLSDPLWPAQTAQVATIYGHHLEVRT